MGKERAIIRCSQSISNWREKILKRYHAEEYVWWRHLYSPVIFFGLYRPMDFLSVLFHRGPRIVHWQGSDILQAGWHYRWLQKIKARHVCENIVEQGVLRLMLQQDVEIVPTFLSNPEDFKVTYKQSKNPEVFIHVNRNAERESGLYTIETIADKVPEITFHVYGKYKPAHEIWFDPVNIGEIHNIDYSTRKNIVYHGHVSEKQFDEEIKNYQGALRLHHFDGMSEIVTKSILMGQYPITAIKYPYIDHAPDETGLIMKLLDLKNRKRPNLVGRSYYLEQFKNQDV